MKECIDVFVKIIDGINAVTKWILIALLSACVTIAFAGVIGRYWLNIAIGWGDEFCRYTMIWMAFIAAGHAARQGRMVRLEVIYVVFRKLPEKFHIVFDWISGLVASFFYVVAICCVWSVMEQIHGLQYSAAFRLPMSFMYSSIVVGCTFLILNTLASLLAPKNLTDVSDAMALADEVSKLTNESGEFLNTKNNSGSKGGQQ